MAVALADRLAERAPARLAGARRRLGGDARRAGRAPAPLLCCSPRRSPPARPWPPPARSASSAWWCRTRCAWSASRAAPLLLPASALGGGAFVVAVDASARTVVAPLQLPVGVLAAAVGVPTFIAMLLRRPPARPHRS